MKSSNISKLFNLFLILVAIHSFMAGIGLIFLPREILEQFGFDEITNKFFPVQGGVFHLIMAAIYIYVVRLKELQYFLVPLIIGIKFIAALFLFTYYFSYEQVVTVLLSGIGDGLMSVILYFFYRKLRSNNLILKKS